MSRWSDCLSKEHQVRGGKKKSPRTTAVRTHCGLHWHRSGAESECCCYLQFLERQGQLEILKAEPNVAIPQAACKIIPDWLLKYPDGERYADYKGHEFDSWKKNRRIWKMYGPLPMEVWKKKGSRFFISEIIQGGSQNG